MKLVLNHCGQNQVLYMKKSVDQLKRIRREHQKLLRNTENIRTGTLKGLSLYSVKKVRLRHE